MNNSAIASFEETIKHAFDRRDELSDAYQFHPDHKVAQYIVRMCESLLAKVHQMGNTSVTLADMVRLEGTCTGADYDHKLALRCFNLGQQAPVGVA
jgi:NADH:ubiquinone oxidoreductase subunit E